MPKATLPVELKDKIYNALVIGMTLEDAYIYTGLTPSEIEAVTEDDALQAEWRQVIKGFEFTLLNRINDISQKQTRMGKEAATTWMLEHMFPRYSGKPISDLPDIHLHIDGTDPANYDTVTITRGKDE